MKESSSYTHGPVQAFKYGSWPFGKPSMYVHIYFLDGLLIDTGHSNMRKQIVHSLKNLSVDKIFLTHHHEDHTGNAKVLMEQFNCQAYGSTLCSKIMKHPPSISFAQWLTWGKSDPIENIISCDNYIETKQHRFTIIPIPGHAVDMVCLHEENEGWLFSADLWVNDYIRYFMKEESMATQIQSIKRILNLDFELMFCAHQPKFKNAKTELRNKLNFLEEFYGNVATLHQTGLSDSAIFSTMNLKENKQIQFLSAGSLSTINMVRSVIRDQQRKHLLSSNKIFV